MAIGQSLLRREDARLLAGGGQYIGDMQAAAMLHAGFLRSPHAQARIRSIDLSGARAHPGITLALDGNDLAALPSLADASSGSTALWLARIKPRLQPASAPVLAVDRVVYAGQALAVVVGQSRYAVEDALDAISVDFEPRPAVADARAALQPGSPLVHPELTDNVLFEFHVSKGDTTSAMTSASHTLARSFRCGRNAPVPLECRGVLAIPDVRTGALTVYSGTQTPHNYRRLLALTLGLAENMVRVVVPDTGGGFGGKNGIYPEDVVVAHAARLLGRPVKWLEDRREDLLTLNHSRDQTIDATVAFDDDGRILAVRAEQLLDAGAYQPMGPVVPFQVSTHLLGPYAIEHFDFTGRAVATNKTPSAPYRGAGRPEATLVMEGLVDGVAAALGLDPAVVRERNLIAPERMPYNVGTPFRDGADIVYDSGDYPELLRRVLAAGEYDELRRRQVALRGEGRLLGIGLACYVEATGTGPFEGASIAIDPSGRLTIATGACSQGQGHDISLAQVVAELWHISPERVTVLLGDTGRIPYGAGTYASRTLQLVSAAAADASQRLQVKLRTLAAGLLEANPDDLELDLGGAQVAVRGDPGRSVSLAQLTRSAAPGWGSAGLDEPGLQATAYFVPRTQAWASAAHLAVVEIDPEIGRVRLDRYLVAHDAGRIVNPLLAEGQVVGGVIQGLGGALLEEAAYDAAGQPLATTFMDYLLPVAPDMPDVSVIHLETPSPHHPLGIKGLGEGGTVGAPAAVANAVADALRLPVTALPVTPERLRELLPS